jgi:hypothetical protein
MQSENTADLSAALAKAQAAMQAAKFDKTNPHFKNKYASLAAVIDAVRKPLADNGLCYTQTTEIREGGLVLVTTLRHGGQWVASEYPLPTAAKPQELGSALTYARRYSLSAIACIAADEDDDAEGARNEGQTIQRRRPRQPDQAQTVAPPVHPETGEVSPHKITAADAMTWGAAFVAAVNLAKDAGEVNQWLADNAEGIDALPEKIQRRVMDRANEKLASFGGAQKEAAE